MKPLVHFYQSCREINEYERNRNQKNKLGKFRLLQIGFTYDTHKKAGMGEHGLHQSHTVRRWADIGTGKGLTREVTLN